MNEEKMENATCGCGCNKMHGMHMHGRGYFAKRILAIIVLFVVFWFGTRLGELRTLMRYSHEPRGMMGWNDDGYGNMMYGTYSTTEAVPATPATPAK